jgi:hypothetical protein
LQTAEVVDLYALPPEEFTAARDAAVTAARADGDRPAAAALAALRRPTVAAYAVNALVRAEPSLVDQLIDLGAALASAQAEGRGGDLQVLGSERRALVEAATAAAVAAAGRDLGSAVRAEVAGTLEAALADPPSGAAVRSGRLVRALAFAGFGGVDLSDAVAEDADGTSAVRAGTAPAASGPHAAARGRRESAAPADGSPKQTAADRKRAERVAAAEQASLAANGALDDAVRRAEQAAADVEEADSDRDAAEREAAEAESALSAAEAALAEAKERVAVAARARREAVAEAGRAEKTAARRTRAVEAAQEEAEAARSALDALRRA